MLFSKLITYNYKTAGWSIIGRLGHFLGSREVLGHLCATQGVAWLSGSWLHRKPWRNLRLLCRALGIASIEYSWAYTLNLHNRRLLIKQCSSLWENNYLSLSSVRGILITGLCAFWYGNLCSQRWQPNYTQTIQEGCFVTFGDSYRNSNAPNILGMRVSFLQSLECLTDIYQLI